MELQQKSEVSKQAKEKADAALKWLSSEEGEKKFDKSYEAAEELTKSLREKREVDVSKMNEAVVL